jgi:hypothetical protein
MGVIQTELDAVKLEAYNRFNSTIIGMKVGDDDTPFTESQTDIISLLEEANLQGKDVSVADQITYTTKYGITSFVGDTIKEVVLKEASGDIKTRNLTVQEVKGADEIFWVDGTVKFIARNK